MDIIGRIYLWITFVFFKEEPWFPAKEGYIFMQSVGEELLVHGTRGPTTKKECEASLW